MFLNEGIRNHIEVKYYWYEGLAHTWREREHFSGDWRFYYNFDEGAALDFLDRTTSLMPDSCYLIPPFTPLTSHVDPGIDPRQLFIHFSAGLSHILPGIYPLPLTRERKEALRELNDDLIETDYKGSVKGAMKALSLVAASLADLPDKALTGGLPDRRIEKALGLIEKDLTVTPAVTELARGAGLSLNHFIALFKKNTGLTPYRFLTEQRINRAVLLLADKNLSMEEISEQCGFCDRYQFSRMFKKLRSIPPAEYRKLQRSRR